MTDLDDTQPIEPLTTMPGVRLYGRIAPVARGDVLDEAAKDIVAIRRIADAAAQKLARIDAWLAARAALGGAQGRKTRELALRFRDGLAAAFLDAALDRVGALDARGSLVRYAPICVPDALKEFLTRVCSPEDVADLVLSDPAAGLTRAYIKPSEPDRTTLQFYAPPGTPIDRSIDGRPLGHVHLKATSERELADLRLAYDSVLFDAIDRYDKLAR